MQPSGILIRALFGLLLAAPAFGQGAAFAPGRLRAREDVEAFLTPPAQDEVAEGFWRVQENVLLHHFAEGSGPPVLFLHGGPGFPPSRPPKALTLLKGEFRFHYYHQRGCGRSTRPVDRFESGNYLQNMARLVQSLGLEQHLADVDRVRRILGAERITLIGHSFGGFLAALYAAEFPERVERLVLVSPAQMLTMPAADGGMFEALKKHLPEGPIRAEYDQYLERFFGVFGTIFQKSEADLVALNREFVKYWAAVLENRGLPVDDLQIPEGLDSGWMPFAVYFSLGMLYDHRPALARITCPVLILHGAEDPSMGAEGLKPYSENLKQVRVEIIPKAGHNSFNEQPEEFAALLRPFLRGDPED